MTGDLREAKIFVASFDERGAGTEQLAGLAAASNFIRREVGQRIHLRSTPALSFHLDTSLAYGARIESLLRDIRQSDNREAIPDDDD